MIEPDMAALAITILVLYLLLMVINYRGFTKYPDRYSELNPYGAGILKSRGAVWFVAYKLVAALVFVLVFIPLSLFFPVRISYIWLGALLGFTWFNLLHDYLTYKQAAKSEQKKVDHSTQKLFSFQSQI